MEAVAFLFTFCQSEMASCIENSIQKLTAVGFESEGYRSNGIFGNAVSEGNAEGKTFFAI